MGRRYPYLALRGAVVLAGRVLGGRKGPIRVEWDKKNMSRTADFLGTLRTLLQSSPHLSSGWGGPLGWVLLILQFLA